MGPRRLLVCSLSSASRRWICVHCIYIRRSKAKAKSNPFAKRQLLCNAMPKTNPSLCRYANTHSPSNFELSPSSSYSKTTNRLLTKHLPPHPLTPTPPPSSRSPRKSPSSPYTASSHLATHSCAPPLPPRPPSRASHRRETAPSARPGPCRRRAKCRR